MSNDINKDVNSIASVYKGAAFLIFVVGLRSVFTTLDEGEGWGFLTILTLFALGLELVLLWRYANTITSSQATPDEAGNYNVTLNTKPLEDKLEEINQKMHTMNASMIDLVSIDDSSPIVEAIKDNNDSEAIVEAINEINISDKITLDATELQSELSEATSEIGMLRNDIGAINKDLAQLNEKINEFVDTGIKERVHNEVNAIIEKMVSSKK